MNLNLNFTIPKNKLTSQNFDITNEVVMQNHIQNLKALSISKTHETIALLN
ncbi:hypothetical protein [Flavobacterium adhaerens]|uniref:hypothetical protein n=1 Tax=Flavobacterium adhaerens TaxID=3149043 RepID=UPI0032B546E6